jgi:hypothetical protein
MNQCVQANLVNQPSEDAIGEHLTLIPQQGAAQDNLSESPVKAGAIDLRAAELNKDLEMEDKY